MPKKELIILKLGGSVITKKDEEKPEVNRENLERLSNEIASAKRSKDFQLVIVHGAGPFGHTPAKEYELENGLKGRRHVEGFSVTHQSMEKLNLIVVGKLQKQGINAIAYQPSSAGILRNKKLIYFPTKIIEKLLALDIVPVAYGDVLLDDETGINILSGDHLVPYLAEKLNANRIIMAVDVPGIFDSDPKKNKDAYILKEISPDNINSIWKIGASANTDVTGGMKRKLDELIGISKIGIESEIISGFEPDILKRALLGERGLGTIIKSNL